MASATRSVVKFPPENFEKMMTRKFLSTAAVLIFAAVFSACGSNLTAETTGQVTRVALDRDTKTVKRKTSSNKTKKTTKTSVETEVDYRYTVGGKTFEGYSEKDGDVQRDFQTGAPVTVCYNPANPEESDVFAAGTKCG
jgi:ABC-type glycerol-3-phosphate transport system substrate-binding protein